MFDVRPHVSLTLRGASVPPAPMEYLILDGNSVELRIEDQRIIVGKVVHKGSGLYGGVVRNFLQSSVLQTKGIKFGMEVEFSYPQIFALD